MNISRHKLYAAGEPFGDSATRVEANKVIYGGGGGSSGTYYGNQDKLFGAQADIAQNLYNQYADYAPGYLANTQTMVNEANNGALGARARNQAGADSSEALGSAMDATRRSTARYGAELNTNRMASENSQVALHGAANKAGAMNSAGQWAEDQKWNRNAGAYGQISGMGTGAMQGMGSAGSGYGSMASSQASNNASNAAGMGKFGSAIGSSMYKADGGMVEQKPGLRLARGGLATPIPMGKVDWRSQRTSGRPGAGSTANAIGSLVAAASMPAIGQGIKAGAGALWNGTKEDSVFGQTRGLRGVIKDNMAPGQQPATPEAPADAYGASPESYQAFDAPVADATSYTDYSAPMESTAASWDQYGYANGGYLEPVNAQASDASYDGSMSDSEVAERMAWRVGETQAAKAGLNAAYAQTAGAPATASNAGATGATSVATDAGTSAATDAATSAATDAAAAGATEAATAGATEAAASTIPGVGPAAGAIVGIANGAPADQAIAQAAGGWGGAQLGAAAGTMLMPGVGTVVGGVLGSALGSAGVGSMFADGGDVQRADFTPGGPVQGPGGPTDDSIPSWLSNGEHVQNATSTQLAGRQTLDTINQIGLAVREGKLDQEEALKLIGEVMVSRGSELASGTPAEAPPAPTRGLKPKQSAPTAEADSNKQAKGLKRGLKAEKFKEGKPAKLAKGGLAIKQKGV